MSKLVENKQIVHIASEIAVLLGMTFYFNQKNKKLMGHIEDLCQRVEEQEDLIQKHEQIIRKLVDHLNQQKTVVQEPSTSIHASTIRPTSTPKVHPKKQNRKKSQDFHAESPLMPPLVREYPTKVSFCDKSSQQHKIEEIGSDEEVQSDLDMELVEELGELTDDHE